MCRLECRRVFNQRCQETRSSVRVPLLFDYGCGLGVRAVRVRNCPDYRGPGAFPFSPIYHRLVGSGRTAPIKRSRVCLCHFNQSGEFNKSAGFLKFQND